MSPDGTPRWSDLHSPIFWQNDRVMMLDQRRLPGQEVWLAFETAQAVAEAIRCMVVRGAPAIACAAAMGIAAQARRLPDEPHAFQRGLEEACQILAEARPTAVNLPWAVQRQQQVIARTLTQGPAPTRQALLDEALAIMREDRRSCEAMGQLGASLLSDGARVYTHCNTGALATGGHGTALGVIRSAIAMGKHLSVLAGETRPYLQGARLTAWELMQDGIDVTLVCDSAAGSLMARGLVDAVLLGADRIAANGDVANKIGTYGLAVLARHHGLPFYVAAPRTTLDLRIADGEQIPIEERPPEEVSQVGGMVMAPAGCRVRNPAFDVTPSTLVTAIITEAGIARPPFIDSLAHLMRAPAIAS